MKKLIPSIAIITLIVFSCSPSKIITTNLHDLSSFETDAKVYSLPKTKLIIRVAAIKYNFIPGPYFQYAKKFLGIEGVKSSPSTTWGISDVSLTKMLEPDIDQYYSVKCLGGSCIDEKILELNKSGLVLSPELIESFQQANTSEAFSVQEIPYTDLTISSYKSETNRKKPKQQLSTSQHETLPAWQKQISGKSVEEKAFEASKFIFKIRKRKFKLLAGQYEVFPEGQALESSIRELNQLEEDYLSLFIGKVSTDTIHHFYVYEPKAGETLQRENLFMFSEETGFYTTTENEGTPLILVVEDLDENSMLNSLQIPLGSNENHLFYRLPDKARVKLLYGSHELLVSELPVYQFGALMPVYLNPNRYLLSRDR